MNDISTIILLIVSVLIGIPVFFYLVPVALWFSALLSGVKLSLMELIFMRLRKSPVQDIVMGLITATKGGIPINRTELEAHALAGGNTANVINGLVAAKHAGLKLSFKNACSSDFKGIDLVKLVHKEVESRKEEEKIFE
ncbi:flotillin-like FloA family protein [Marinifilum fragile]|uniref:flotillin-like FloA family protein n=1 Tax=Marinifilum fragile TaxID=570161 RepID=UPI0006CF91D8|nr:flotillin-like FloA family protein [Marinifilum fragile]